MEFRWTVFNGVDTSPERAAAFADVPEKRIAAYSAARRKALKSFSEKVMSNGIRWCVVSVPTKKWAEKVFPDAADPVYSLEVALEGRLAEVEGPHQAHLVHGGRLVFVASRGHVERRTQAAAGIPFVFREIAYGLPDIPGVGLAFVREFRLVRITVTARRKKHQAADRH